MAGFRLFMANANIYNAVAGETLAAEKTGEHMVVLSKMG